MLKMRRLAQRGLPNTPFCCALPLKAFSQSNMPKKPLLSSQAAVVKSTEMTQTFQNKDNQPPAKAKGRPVERSVTLDQVEKYDHKFISGSEHRKKQDRNYQCKSPHT